MQRFCRQRLVVYKQTRPRFQMPRARFDLASVFRVTSLVAVILVCGPPMYTAVRHSKAYASWQQFKDDFVVPRPDIWIKRELDAWNEYWRPSASTEASRGDDLELDGADLYSSLYAPTDDRFLGVD